MVHVKADEIRLSCHYVRHSQTFPVYQTDVCGGAQEVAFVDVLTYVCALFHHSVNTASSYLSFQWKSLHPSWH